MTKILLISGSLRKDSFNKLLLQAVEALAPEGVTFEYADIGLLPLFNDDLDTDEARPNAVTNFRKQVRESDGILIASPEYNYAIPGVLKNALDWGSRPYAQGVWAGKPFAVMGASPGFMGAARSTQDTRAIAIDLQARVFAAGEILLASAHTAFDAEGKLTNENTRNVLVDYITRYVSFIEDVKREKTPSGDLH